MIYLPIPSMLCSVYYIFMFKQKYHNQYRNYWEKRYVHFRSAFEMNDGKEKYLQLRSGCKMFCIVYFMQYLTMFIFCYV